ncbi:LOW QUALITY PROTEIN: polyprotein [Phytophthora megakarya]|uniref:Polyprotein n=1 Tax=Phytophthora megakarya TaxID=4795 RepID=A0A225W9K5_9STRA|nr:LOW QUALITY PROTEIN: polyprotein [Phytophthora megakarya]
MVMIENTPVVFKWKFKKTVTLSSAEAEYVVLSMCVQEAHVLRAMLKDMCIRSSAEAEYVVLSMCVQEVHVLRAMLKDMCIVQEEAAQI